MGWTISDVIEYILEEHDINVVVIDKMKGEDVYVIGLQKDLSDKLAVPIMHFDYLGGGSRSPRYEFCDSPYFYVISQNDMEDLKNE